MLPTQVAVLVIPNDTQILVSDDIVVLYHVATLPVSVEPWPIRLPTLLNLYTAQSVASRLIQIHDITIIMHQQRYCVHVCQMVSLWWAAYKEMALNRAYVFVCLEIKQHSWFGFCNAPNNRNERSNNYRHHGCLKTHVCQNPKVGDHISIQLHV